MPIDLKVEYWQASTDGNPGVALQWSLLPSVAAVDGNATAAITAAAADAATGKYDAVVIV